MSKMKEINSVNLMCELEKRNLAKREVSRELGFKDGYLNDCIRRGRIGNGAVKMLEVLYNIHPDSYCNVEKVEEKVPEVEKESVIDYDRLREVIYDAVYWAVKKAWAE